MLRLLFALLLANTMVWATDTVLYQENFEHGSVGLSGQTPTVTTDGASWTSRHRGERPSIFGDGRVSGNRELAIWLPFLPQSGFRYTLEATLLMRDGPTDRGISLGFAAVDSNQTFDQMTSYGTMVMYRNPKAVFSAFAGPGREGEIPVPGGTLRPTLLRIILDASSQNSSDWTLSFFVHERLVEEGIKIPPALGSLADIQFVGFTVIGGGGSGEIQTFTLTRSSAAQ